MKYYALIDGASDRLLVLTNGDKNTLLHLNRFTLDSVVVSIKPKNLFQKLFLKMLVFWSGKYNFIWEHKKSQFVFKEGGETYKDKYILLSKKYTMLRNILDTLELELLDRTTFPLKDYLYLSKKIEADKYISNNYPEKDILDFPYIYFEAKSKGLSYKEVAGEILVKSKLYDAVLAKKEAKRQKNFTKIAEAKTIKELHSIYEELISEQRI